MSEDPLDIIETASKQFVDQLVGLPRRVDTLEEAVRLVKRVLNIELGLLLLVIGHWLKTVIEKYAG
jgi:hypothetical protein